MVDPPLGLYVVCDGMGGGNAGEIASVAAATPARLPAPSQSRRFTRIWPRQPRTQTCR